MSRISTFFFLYTVITHSYSRYFDVCPSRKISIGACLAGLCPLGSECINNYCCKARIVTTTPGIEDIDYYGKCRDGQDAIGECVSKLCPSGYICEEDLCCDTVKAKTFVPFTSMPSTSSTSSVFSSTPEEPIEIVEIIDITAEPNVNVYNTTPQVDKGIEDKEEQTSKWIETTTTDMTEIESIRRSFKVIKSKESNEIEVGDIITTTAESTNYETTEWQTKDVSSTPSTTQETTVTTMETMTNPEWQTTESSVVELTTEQVQICPIGDSIGECISDQCPEGHTCFQNVCCIITPQINCTDTLKGCLPHLCDKRGYKEFTTLNCAKTCARCHVSEVQRSSSDVEIVVPIAKSGLQKVFVKVYCTLPAKS
ncbi:unnamed protein product [Strongylus vulgaris]|uniref:ShKT domain-containing protein n=1 Tax=Strongylus vulgaris TaxID=40348 RepID=A0A3P7JF30_STRVU|nr:unnamed protein product [Strongylus vulgaris]